MPTATVVLRARRRRTRFSRRTSRVLLALGAAALSAAVCELAARLVIPGGPGAALRERETFLIHLPVQTGAETAEPDNAAVSHAYSTGFVLHPFFGYTFRPQINGANNQGFFPGGPGGDFPHRRQPREFVIGLFGGSVAMQLGLAQSHLLERLRPALAGKGYERVTLLSFAVGGWRQPQSFFALVYYLDAIDLAIDLEGFNEVIQLGSWQLGRQPASFPWSEVYETLAHVPSVDETLRRAELIREHRAAARITRWLDRPGVRSSALAHLAWRVYVRRYDHRVSALRAETPRYDDQSRLEPATSPEAVETKRRGYMQFWHDLVLFSDLIARRKGKPFFDFIQPNQYDRDAKPLSEEERTLYTKNDWFDAVTKSYGEAEAMTAGLRVEGVEAHFLGRVFAATRETVYMDDCCHLNERGIMILSNAIADRVLASGELETVREAQ